MKLRYRALTTKGRTVSGMMEQTDVPAAIAALRASGHLPIDVSPAGNTGRLAALLDFEITPSSGLSPRDRIALTDALATLLGAGLPLDKALAAIKDFGSAQAAAKVSDRLLERITGGESLAAALDAEPRSFPAHYRGIVRAGEASATLAPVLARLAASEMRSAKRRAALVSALIYPAFLVVTAILSIAVLLVFVVPTFEPMLEAAGTELPALTQAVMGVGRMAAVLWPFLLTLVFAVTVLYRVAVSRRATRTMLHRFWLRVPLMGGLRRKIGSAAIARILAELLAGGVSLPQALRLTEGTLSDAAFAAEIARVRPLVEGGERLADSFATGRILSPLAVKLVDVGARSGQLASMLSRAADILEDDAQTSVDRLMAMITPLVTLVMGGVIALIVSSILFALFSLNDLTGV